MLKISYAGFLGLSQNISTQFTFEMCDVAHNREKSLKTLFWKFKVIDLDVNRKVIWDFLLSPISHQF